MAPGCIDSDPPIGLAIVTRKQAIMLGLRHYFTGKPCRRGHIAKRQVIARSCTDCDRENCRKQYVERAEWRRQRSREWAAQNPAAHHARARKWKLENPSRVRQHSEKSRSRPENKAKALIRVRKWQIENPEKVHANKVNNRAKRARAPGKFRASDLRAIFKAQRGRCAYCKALLAKDTRHLDHIIPLAAGGTNWPSNLQFTCEHCNVSKNARDPIAYAQSLGMLL